MTTSDTYRIAVVSRLADIDAAAWNRMVPDGYPFLRHEFLAGLEEYACLSATIGWVPQHFVLYDRHNQLLAAAPAYIKHNSFGEFVFDHTWAAAYQHAGLDYYPKLVLAIPFTPATGKRLLTAPAIDPQPPLRALLAAILEFAHSEQLSGVHCLFPDAEDRALLQAAGLLLRMDYQYHWHNQAYSDFNHYLAFFRAHKRKTVRQERARIHKHGISLSRVRGDELNDRQLQDMYRFYRSTFMKKSNYPALTLEFFKHLSRSMGDRLLLIFAHLHGEAIAGAMNFRSDQTLYGRYWGCDEELSGLHFEVCFYQGIEYCIENALQRYEPGAQGEHKITRGFLPAETWSVHWLCDSRFNSAIGDFLQQEAAALHRYRPELDKLSPFRTAAVSAP
jgi:predicted N-acyltransferase